MYGDYVAVGTQNETIFMYQLKYDDININNNNNNEKIWTQIDIIQATGPEVEGYYGSDAFGVPIAMYENTMLVGANRDDYGYLNDGSVYIFELHCDDRIKINNNNCSWNQTRN